MEEGNLEASNFDNDADEQQDGSPVKPSEMSPSKNIMGDDETKNPKKNLGSSSKKTSMPKRNLRERKPRATYNSDIISKCHI